MTENATIAQSLIAARRSGTRIDTGALAIAPRSRADCYAIQQAVAEEFGPAAAFKTGRAAPGDEPIMAPILAGTVRPSGAVFSRDELSVIGVELEIGFRINRPLPDPSADGFADRVRACVSPLPAIEVVDTRLADPEAAGEFWMLADNQNNGGLVCGDPVAAWDHLDLTAGTIELTVGGTREFSGSHKVPGGDAFDVFCAFARIAGDHCGGIRVGQTVITGSLMGCLYIEPGQTVAGSIAGLGGLEIAFS